ncbi:hypothetical protein AVEN_254637-1 [Araneus ventricosus]|uniref:Uncharacterized protein n=1 Tax=Araneus ventricosus TaxID=182803 RepID=A0A4Y2QN18_ARAVE|nr:hypothetical protein AVEN_254637-1 [Araneus ventricosus]
MSIIKSHTDRLFDKFHALFLKDFVQTFSPEIECIAPESAQPIPLTFLILIGKKAIRVDDLKTDKALNSLRFFVGEQVGHCGFVTPGVPQP